MGYYYRLEQAKRKEKIFSEKQKEFLERSKSFPNNENELTQEQHQLKRDYLLLRAELAALWYQVGKSCPSDKANQYYVKAAGLGYFRAQQQLKVIAEIDIKEDADLQKYTPAKVKAAAVKLDAAGCYWYAVYLDKVVASHAQIEAIQAEEAGKSQKAATKREYVSACRQQAFLYYDYAAIQRYPHALVDMAWILIHEFARNTENHAEQAKYFEMANQYLTLAMDEDHAEAFYKKGMQYQKGWGEAENKALALKYFREAAKRGFSDAIKAIDEDYKANYSRYLDMHQLYVSDPKRLARTILDSDLGAHTAKQLLQELKTKISLVKIADPFVRKLFSLVVPEPQEEKSVTQLSSPPRPSGFQTTSNAKVLRLLLQSPSTPPERFLHSLVSDIPDLIYPLAPNEENKNSKSFEPLLGTREGDVITLRTGFLSALFNYLIAKALDDERAFEFTLALINTDSEIIHAAITESVRQLVLELIKHNIFHCALALNSMLPPLLRRKFYDEEAYQRLLDSITSLKPYTVYLMLILLFVAVRQGIKLNDRQIRFFNSPTYDYDIDWEASVRRFHYMGDASIKSIIKELLLSAENSAFWQVVEFKREKKTEIHGLRRSLDENYGKLVRILLRGFHWTTPSVLAPLVLEKNIPQLVHAGDYLYFLQHYNLYADRTLILLFICQQLHITIPDELFKGLLDRRHEMIEFLRELKKTEPQVTRTLLLEITKEAKHDEKNRMYLSAVFQLPRVKFLGIGVSPNPKDPNDAIGKAHTLLKEVNQELQANPTTVPVVSAVPPMPSVSESADKLEVKTKEEKEKTVDEREAISDSTVGEDDLFPSGLDILGPLTYQLSQQFSCISTEEKVEKEQEKESWPKEKSGSDAKAITNNSVVLSKSSAEKKSEDEKRFNPSAVAFSPPTLRPDPRGDDALL